MPNTVSMGPWELHPKLENGTWIRWGSHGHIAVMLRPGLKGQWHWGVYWLDESKVWGVLEQTVNGSANDRAVAIAQATTMAVRAGYNLEPAAEDDVLKDLFATCTWPKCACERNGAGGCTQRR